jgi:uncharacterized membrane protein YraQ (UPF0718 family)
MIKAIHYIVAGLLILGFTYQIHIFYNVAAGLMFGFGIGSWIQYIFERAERDERIKEIKELSNLIHTCLKSKTYDSKIPDGESCREK